MIKQETDLSYVGDVHLKLKVHGKTLDLNKHNNGLPNLFRIISRALAGFDISADTPSTVDLRYTTSGDDWVSCLINPQHISMSYKNYDGYFAAIGTGAIPYSALEVVPITALKAKGFRLYLSSQSDDLAFIDINAADIALITPGSQALVEWVLRVGNA